MLTPNVELYAAIRRDSRNGLSGRAIERKYHVTWSTVNKALTSAWPEPRRKPPPRGSKLDPFKPAIDAILRADLDAPRKQRHTVRRIVGRLIEEHAMTGVSYQVVRAYGLSGNRRSVSRLVAARRRCSSRSPIDPVPRQRLTSGMPWSGYAESR